MKMRNFDFYGILGLDNNATEEEIKKKYRKLVKKYHPDLNPDEEARNKFEEITYAYESLLNKSNNTIVEKLSYEELLRSGAFGLYIDENDLKKYNRTITQVMNEVMNSRKGQK